MVPEDPPKCRACGASMVLLDSEVRRWYCYADDQIYFAKENRWVGVTNDERLKAIAEEKAREEEKRAQYASLTPLEVVKEAERRFKINMAGSRKGEFYIRQSIADAEREGKTPEVIIELLKEKQVFSKPIMGGIGRMAVAIAEKSAVPLTGPLTPKQEKYLNHMAKHAID